MTARSKADAHSEPDDKTFGEWCLERKQKIEKKVLQQFIFVQRQNYP